MDDAMPVDFLCAITLEPMQDPVVCADGHSYERAAIEYWLTSHATSPKTGAVLDHANVVPNHALRSRIEAWRVEHFRLIRSADLTLGAQIGAGSFNAVFQATLVQRVAGRSAVSITVAAARRWRADEAATMDEVKLLVKLSGHPHLVRFLGLCKPASASDAPLVITEFAPLGSLSDFVELHEDDDEFSPAHKHTVLRQICRGMHGLAEAGFVHRDLAARNVLVFAFNPLDTFATRVKVADFGLSIDRYGATYRTVDGEAVPLRYMPPESLKKRRFSEKSDVWAFGVTAWEILTDGDLPSFDLADDDASFVRKVVAGERLAQPPGVAPGLWDIIGRCWETRKTSRPTFAHLVEELAQLPLPEVTSSSGRGASCGGGGGALRAPTAAAPAHVLAEAAAAAPRTNTGGGGASGGGGGGGGGSASSAPATRAAAPAPPRAVATPAEIKAFWATDMTDMTHVDVPYGVTEIPREAFHGCGRLVSAVLPVTVRKIGDYAFYGCSSLAAFVVPDSVTKIGEGAFWRCTSLTTASLPSGATLGVNVFEDSPTTVTTRR